MQICQLSPWEVSQQVAVQPALIAQAFEFAFKVSYRASLCGWFWDVWISASSFQNTFSGSDDRN